MTYRDLYLLNPMFILADEHLEEWSPEYQAAFYSDTIANRQLDETMLWEGI